MHLRPRSTRYNGIARTQIIVAVVIVATAIIGVIVGLKSQKVATDSIPATATSTTVASTTQTAMAPVTPTDYMALVARENSDFPTTEPLALPVDSLNDAARLIFSDPIFLDATGDLWIQRSDAPPVNVLLKAVPLKGQVHLTRDRVVFRYNTSDLEGNPHAQLVIEIGPGAYQFVNEEGRIEIGTNGRNYRWDRAAWVAREHDSGIVLPTDTGIAIMRPQQRPIELYQDLLTWSEPTTAPATAQASTSPSIIPEPRYLLDWRGLVAWIPYVKDQFDGAGAARFVDGKWTRLDVTAGWPRRIVHLDPLNDPTCLQLVADEAGNVSVESKLLDEDLESPENLKDIEAQIARLSDRDPKVRDEALDQLTRYGTGAWTILEKERDKQSLEAQTRIDQILSNKSRGMLGRMILEDGPLHVVAYFSNGGALLFSEAGVSSADLPADSAPITAPAWIVLSPGQPTQLASPFLITELAAKDARLSDIFNEYIITTGALGPQRFIGNHLEPVLRKSERNYSKIVGVDGKGRWLFHHESDDGKTLIIDPTLPDATPKLPAWQYPVEGGSVGWTAAGWPVVKKGGAWVIDKDGTRALDEKKEKLLTEFVENEAAVTPTSVPATSAPATTRSTTLASTTAPTTAIVAPIDPKIARVIGVDEDGGRYFDGQGALRRRPKDAADASRDIVWQLPGEAAGASHATVIGVGGKVFLFNEPGRVIRLNRSKDESKPFKYEATFSRNIPNVDNPMRIWLDPAGRIVIAYEGNKLTILFPSGTIPNSIASTMLGQDLQANQPE